jgi:hypothetical protein
MTCEIFYMRDDGSRSTDHWLGVPGVAGSELHETNYTREPYPCSIAAGSTECGRNLYIPRTAFDNWHDEFSHLYVWGWAEYDDVFDGTERHRTEFCYSIGFSDRHAADIVSSDFIRYRHYKGNGVDQECRHPAAPYTPPFA